MSKEGLFTSESVSEGHPDKVCDRISDAILDAYLEQDPFARVACETLISENLVVIAGETHSTARVDAEAVAREAIRSIGYTDETAGFCDPSPVQVRLHAQSVDIRRRKTPGIEGGDSTDHRGRRGMQEAGASVDT